MKFEYYIEELKKDIDIITLYNRSNYDEIILSKELFFDFLKLWNENKIYNNYFMRILKDIDINIFTEKSIRFMLDCDIAIEYISHLPLNINIIKMIAKKSEDAKYMLFYRLCNDKNYNEHNFAIEFDKYYSDDIYMYIYSLIDKLEDLQVNEEILDYVAMNKSKSEKIIGIVHKRIVARKLLFEESSDKLYTFVEKNDYIFDLKICKNIFASKEILQKLSKVSGIKYSKRIRNDALNTLRLKELLNK